MIELSNGSLADIDESKLTELEKKMLAAKKEGLAVHRYNKPDDLLFELRMRSSIVGAAAELDKSGVGFASFKKSRCNKDFWNRDDNGGFTLKPGVRPQDGIRDIFANGQRYAFECATAVLVVMYKAVLDNIDPDRFDALFPDLVLYDGQHDNDLRLISQENNAESLPGDILYFENPDFLESKSWWRGENTIKLDDDLYFGLGIGMTTAEGIIQVLNKNRNPGSEKSAFLKDSFLQLDFPYYSAMQPSSSSRRSRPVVAFIGARTYVR